MMCKSRLFIAMGLLSLVVALPVQAKTKAKIVPPQPYELTRMDGALPRIDLWQAEQMPNSRGLDLKDSIYNSRTWRIMMPRIYAYLPGMECRTRTALLVIPGGGYAKQAYETAGDATAKWLNSMGITAFVLLHRLPTSPDLMEPEVAPLQDAQRAMRYIRAHASEYGIDPHRIGVMGASAGGHVCASVCSIRRDVSQCGDALDTVSFRPDFAILISPVISMDDEIVNKGSRSALLGDSQNDPAVKDQWSMEKHVTSANPPTLFIHAADDPAVPLQNSLRMYQALVEAGVKGSSIHIFPQGKHSIAVRNQPGSTVLWPQIADLWLQEIGMLEPQFPKR